jgi:hypothetical protein
LGVDGGNYPNIDEAGLTTFCLENQIIDDLFTLKDMQEVFKEANIEFTEDEND